MASPEIVIGSGIVSTPEVTIATLTQWWPYVDVYVDPQGDANAHGTIWNVYAVAGGQRTLLASGQFTNGLETERVLTAVAGAGTTIELAAVTAGNATTAALKGALVGYDPASAPDLPATPTEAVTGVTAGVTWPSWVTVASLTAWHAQTSVLVDASGVAGPGPLEADWRLVAHLGAGFDCAIAGDRLTAAKETLFQGFYGGAAYFTLQIRNSGNDTANGIGVSLVGNASTSANVSPTNSYDVVTNVAALVALTPTATARTIGFLGYYTANDGGGGDAHWDPASVAAVDNGLVFAPTGWVGAGRWLRLYEGAKLAVKWFGAHGDNATDDHAPIQSCINAVSALGGGSVVFDASSYYTGNTTITVPPLVSLEGQGERLSIVRYAGTGDAISQIQALNASTASWSTLRNLGVYNSGGASAGAGFHQQGGTYVEVNNCRFYGHRDGVVFDQTETSFIRGCDFEINTRCGVYLTNGADIQAGSLAGYTNDITIEDCAFGAGPYGIIDDGGNTHNFYNNEFNGQTTFGMRLGGASPMVLQGNYFETVGGGIFISGKTYVNGTPAGLCMGPFTANLISCFSGHPIECDASSTPGAVIRFERNVVGGGGFTTIVTNSGGLGNFTADNNSITKPYLDAGAQSIFMADNSGRVGINTADPAASHVGWYGLDIVGALNTRERSQTSLGATNIALDASHDSFLRLDSAANYSIGGITGNTSGQNLTITNVGSHVCTLLNEDAGSLTYNRITTGTAANVALQAGASAQLIYDYTALRWRMCGIVSPAAASGLYGLFASRPTAGTAGRIYIPSDGGPSAVDDGSQWRPILPVNSAPGKQPPAAASFTTTNFGTATLTDANGVLRLKCPGGVATTSRRCAFVTPPAPPYKLRAGFILNASPNSAPTFGLALRDSGTGKLVMFEFYWSANTLNFQNSKWTNETTVSAAYATLQITSMASLGGFMFLRIFNDGANLSFEWSLDGANWTPLDNRLANDFLANINQVGIEGQSQVASAALPPLVASIYDFEVA